MAVNLENIDNVLTNPNTVNLHKNRLVERDIKIDNRTDLASSNDMGQNFIYANNESLESDPRMGKYKIYTGLQERTTIGSMNSGVQRAVKSLPLKSIKTSLGSTASTSAADAYKISSSNPFTVTIYPTPNVTDLKCNINLIPSSEYTRFFTITKINNFNFTVTPDYEGLKEYRSTYPYSIRFSAEDRDNTKIAYKSTGVHVDGYLTIEEAATPSSGTGNVQYVHIMYSATSDHRDMQPVLSGATWLGILTDFNVTASNDPNDYTWTYIKGDPGSEGQAGKDGVDGINGKDAVADPTVQVNVSSNIFPVGSDGWAIENKDLTYLVKAYNTNSIIESTVSADGSGNMYANVANWLDAFTLGKSGLDLWTLFENPGHQEITVENVSSDEVTRDSITGCECIDVALGNIRDLAFLKEGNICYSRMGFYIKSEVTPNVVPSKVALLYWTNGLNVPIKYASLVEDVGEYTQGGYKYLSTYRSWYDSTLGNQGSWIGSPMYVRFYFPEHIQDATIKIFEHMVVNLNEVLPSGHTLAQYMENAKIFMTEDIKSVMDLLPWWSGEYEAGVNMTWGVARRMFTNTLEFNLTQGDIKIDPNYVSGFVYNDIEYSLIPGSADGKIQVEPANQNWNETTFMLTIPTSGKIYLRYQVSDDFEDCWDFSGSTALVCNTTDLPYVKYGLDLTGCIGITGSTEDIPRVTEKIILEGCTGISGSVLDLPEVRTKMSIRYCLGIDGSANLLWWMKERPDLRNSSVTGDYPY